MSKSFERVTLGIILLLFAGTSVVGITWGLPTRRIDPYLFGDDPPWPGEKIHRLARAGEKFSPNRGADVDADPIDRSAGEPVLLTASEEDVASIYLRYRLYTHQPDEMITMRALAGMSPRQLDFDPRLYQYGGLYLYPVGALVKACGIVGLIDVRSDLVYYLDHPDEFGKFYVVARAYSAGWGLFGVWVVFLIGRRLGGSGAGLLASLLFTLMPVVVCMSHEGKPHLPGAVLMLTAVLLAMQYLSSRAAGLGLRQRVATEPSSGGDERPRGLKPAARSGLHSLGGNRSWWLMCVCCGAALGMVLSSWPIFVLIPAIALIDVRRTGPASDAGKPQGTPSLVQRLGPCLKRTAMGLTVATLVYLITNPYIVINALLNREVLQSNFGNSLAMYEIARVGAGLIRVLELTVEGATLPMVLVGAVALIAAIVRKKTTCAPLAISAAVFFLQFVLIGAGKPAEYGRFGIFTNTALAIGAACVLTHRWGRLRVLLNWVPATAVVLWVALHGGLYLMNFRIDTTMDNWRTASAQFVGHGRSDPDARRLRATIAVVADPAPYGCPPLDFARTQVVLLPNLDESTLAACDDRTVVVRPVDRFPWPHDNYLLAMKLLSRDVFGQPRRRSPGWAPPPSTAQPIATPISWANKPILEEALWMRGEPASQTDTSDTR